MTQINKVQFTSIEALVKSLQDVVETPQITCALGEVTINVAPTVYVQTCLELRDRLGFDTLIDICGVDYSGYKDCSDTPYVGLRYAVVVHLLSVQKNCRIRVRCLLYNDEQPMVSSLTEVWPAAGWYEREAFDMFGIVFDGNTDLRRILTDYGFIGHPLRKDFPVTGHVEMRYDDVLKRVVYQAITIEPRENTPKIIRESGYAGR